MKGKLFLGVSLLTLTLASCNEDEQVAINQGRGISFRTAINNPMTRATDLTTDNLKNNGGFYVYGFEANGDPLIDNANFTSDNGIDWDEATGKTYFYPTDGSTVNFFAYAPSLALAPTCTQTLFSVEFTPETTMNTQKDFVFGTATGNNSTADAGVQLTLDHKLSKIQIRAKNTNTEYEYKVSGVRIAANKDKGTFTYESKQKEEWSTDNGSHKVYEVTFNGEKTLTEEPQIILENNDDSFLLVPQQLTKWDSENDKTNSNKGAYISVKVAITAKTSGKEIVKDKWVAVPVATKWDMKHKYIYTLDFSNGAGVIDPTDPDKPGEPVLGKAIEFTVTVGEWTDVDTGVDMDNNGN